MNIGQQRTAAGKARRGHRRGGAVVMALAAVTTAAVVSVQPAAAAGATSVTPGTVAPASNIAGGNTTYTVPFTTSGSGALGAGGSITLSAPDGTAFPSCSGSCGSTYTVAVNNTHSATVGSVALSAVAGPNQTDPSSTNNQAVLTLATSSIAAGDVVTLTISSVENPVVASTTYKMAESTSADTNPTDSADYTIVAGPPTAVIATGGDNQTTAASSAFPVPMTATVVDAHGNPVPSSALSGDSIKFAAPGSGASLTFASSGTTATVAIGGNGQATAPAATANSTAGGPYTVSATLVATSGGAAIGGVSATSFELENSASAPPPPTPHVTPGTVTLSSHTEAASPVTYGIPFTTSASGALGNNGTITFVAPAGTAFPACTTACGNYSIGVSNSHMATVSTVSPTAANGSATTNKIVITLGLLTTIASGDTVTVTVTGVGNPKLATTQNFITESTSSDTTTAQSPTYDTVHGAATKVVAISGGGQSAQIGTQFQAPLVAEVEDLNGNGVPGQTVSFTVAPAVSGASATFANNTAEEPDQSDSSGLARTSFLTANSTTGGPYTVTASAIGLTSATFSLTNTAGQVAPAPVVLGNDAAAASNVTYTVEFTTSPTGAMASGGTVTFVAPAGTVWPVQTNGNNANYVATSVSQHGSITISSVTPTANQVVIHLGTALTPGELVQFSIGGVTNPTKASSTYTLQESTSADNTPATSPAYAIVPAQASQITATGGDGQSAAPSSTFAQPLSVLVTDANSNPVSGVTVTFTPQPTGAATATFASCPVTGSTASICKVNTGTDGAATSSTLTANGSTGSYPVVASMTIAGTTVTATFNLTNAQVLNALPITVTPDTAGANTAVYTVPFKTSGTGGAIPSAPTCGGHLGSMCQFTLVAPNGTVLPADTGSYGVAVDNNHDATIADVSLSSVQGPGGTGVSATPNQAVLTLDASSIGNGDTVTVTISGVTNPTAAGSGYTFVESTSSDNGPVGSPSYSITAAAPSTIAIVNGNDQGTTVGTSFPTALEVNVTDAYNNPVAGDSVTFTVVPASGAGANFATCPGAGSSATSCVVTTDSQGDATASVLTANSTKGSYQVTVADSTITAPNLPAFDLTNLAPTLTVVNGPQTAKVGTAYSPALQVKVLDTQQHPVSGVSVTFTAPTSAPSGTFASCPGAGSTSTKCVVTSIGDGTATASAFTADNQSGQFTVVVSSPAADPVNLDLTNNPDTVAGSSAASVVSQTATTGTAFGSPLAVQVVDRFGNPVPNATVIFTTPTSGPSATFDVCGGGSTPNTCAATTDANGIATANPLIANTLAGTYQVTATVGGAPDVVFHLTNVHHGYWMVAGDGGLFTLGNAPFYGSEGGAHLNAPVVGMAEAKDSNGYYLAGADGSVFAFGPGAIGGSRNGQPLNKPIVGIAVDPVSGGYWLVASDGGVFNGGGAPFYGSHGGAPLNKPIVGIGAVPGGGGYYLVASDGGIFNYGPTATFYGSHGGAPLNKPIVGMAAVPGGYYLVASDGGIFNYGSGAPFYGSHGGAPLNKPIVGMAVDPTGGGYWLVASDGGIFNYGDAVFYGSEGSTRLNSPVVGMASSG